MAWSGYVENASQQTPQALAAIRVLIAVVPAVVLAAAIVVAWTYPLTRTRHQEIQAELARRRAGRMRDWAAGERPARPAASE